MVEINLYPRTKSFGVLLELFPPVLAKNFMPNWYKEQNIYYRYLDAQKDKVVNLPQERIRKVRQCPAIQDVLKDGIVIKAWSDFYVSKIDEGAYYWEMDIGNNGLIETPHKDWLWVDSHGVEQTSPMELNGIKNYGILKFVTPFFFYTPPGYGLEFTDPFYHHRRNIKILPGKVETDKWHEVNFPFEFYFDLETFDKKTLFIKAGDPLIVARPYKIEKQDINLKVNDWTPEYVDKQHKNDIFAAATGGVWSRYKKFKKEEEE